LLGGEKMKREEIIQAALLSYSKHGYQGATMKKIADEVGIKPASIYFFYENKEALFIQAFQQILQNHHDAMKKVLDSHRDQPVNEVFSAMLRGIVDHHTTDFIETTSYISLVTAPIPEIKTHLHQYMVAFNEWLVGSLEDALRRDIPSIDSKDVDRVIKQFVLLGNGVFWGINLYEGTYLDEQVELAVLMSESLFNQLSKTYS
jgi:AcrR family transcriptional regulator